jgi:choline-sulfatase
MISRRTFLQGAATARQSKKPNFLFILADDHAGYVLGVDGNRQAETPNLDRLASEGTRFAAHFCNSPVCTPSRQSFLTGQLPHSAGVTVLKTPLAGEKPTIAKQLKRAGYQTAVFGKMHFNRPSEPGLHGFDHMMTEQDLAKAWTAREGRPIPKGIATKPPWKPFQDPARIWLNSENLPYPRHEQDMRSALLLQYATQYMKDNRDKQTAVWVSFQEPHSPYDFPLEDRNHFTAAQFKAPVPGKEDAWQIPLIFRDLSDLEKQGIAAAYYNSVRYLDRNIGRLLQHVDDNTVVVYMADHGYSLGQHGRFEKHCCYEPALRVPLLIRWPGKVRQGVVTGMTESIDVAPTILDLLDAPPLSIAHGQSLRPYLEGKRPTNPRNYIFSEYLENEEACVRTAQYKFIHCSGKRERTDGYKTDNPTPGRYIRLYDLKTDPGEFTDLSRQRPRVVADMQNLMLKRFRETHPEASSEPKHAANDEILDWYLRPRDA